MKKNILGSVAFAAMVALSLTSCNKSQPQVEVKSESKAPAELKIAYVEVDSIMTQYKFAKEYAAILEKKSQNIQATLAQKQQNLQAAAANFQQQIQQNALSREAAEQRQAALQKQNNDLQGLQQRLSNEFASEQEKYNKALHDSCSLVVHFSFWWQPCFRLNVQTSVSIWLHLLFLPIILMQTEWLRLRRMISTI